jgi:hypothetical protein
MNVEAVRDGSGGFQVVGADGQGNRVPLAYTTTRDEADTAMSTLANIGEAPTFAGITRNEAIELCNGAIARLEALAKNRKNGTPFVAGLKNGARVMLRELATAGAFSDGKNMSDRLPLQPGEVTP